MLFFFLPLPGILKAFVAMFTLSSSSLSNTDPALFSSQSLSSCNVMPPPFYRPSVDATPPFSTLKIFILQS